MRAVKHELRSEYRGQSFYVKCRALTAKRFECGWTVYRNGSTVYGGTARATRYSRAWDVTSSERCNSRLGDDPGDCFGYSD